MASPHASGRGRVVLERQHFPNPGIRADPGAGPEPRRLRGGPGAPRGAGPAHRGRRRARGPRPHQRGVSLCSRRSAASPTTTCPTSRELLAAARVEGSTSSRARSCRRGLVHRGRRRDRAARGPGRGRAAARAAAPPRWRDAERRGRAPSAARSCPTGEVADDASPAAGRDRGARLARLQAQLQSVMESFLRGKDADRLLQDKLVTTRNDRYVLLLKAEHRGPGARASSTAAPAPGPACSWSPCRRWS